MVCASTAPSDYPAMAVLQALGKLVNKLVEIICLVGVCEGSQNDTPAPLFFTCMQGLNSWIMTPGWVYNKLKISSFILS